MAIICAHARMHTCTPLIARKHVGTRKQASTHIQIKAHTNAHTQMPTHAPTQSHTRSMYPIKRAQSHVPNRCHSRLIKLTPMYSWYKIKIGGMTPSYSRSSRTPPPPSHPPHPASRQCHLWPRQQQPPHRACVSACV